MKIASPAPSPPPVSAPAPAPGLLLLFLLTVCNSDTILRKLPRTGPRRTPRHDELAVLPSCLTVLQIFETATSGVRNDPLAAYHPPPETKVPTTRPEQEPDRWVPMNHNRLSSLYNPLTHDRMEILQVKKDTLVRAHQDVDLIIKKGGEGGGEKGETSRGGDRKRERQDGRVRE